VEHIVPESLGNDSEVLQGIVCDKCQNYLSHSVEKPALESTPLGFWRTHLGVLTKKKKLPSFSSAQRDEGRIPSRHAASDIFKLEAEEDGTTSIELAPEKLNRIMNGEECRVQIVITPWHLSIMGRLLGKIGLEYVARERIAEAMLPSLDPIRRYVREGAVSRVWPIYFGQSGQLSELRLERTTERADEREIVTECYRYVLGEKEDGGYVFVFGQGIDLFLIDLSKSVPDDETTRWIGGCTLKCVYYEPGTF
jgi:hypothetical protein